MNTLITEAESRVMEVLWKRSPLRASEVISALSDSSDWHEKTIKTLLGRLLRKGALTHTREGQHYLYSPALSRGNYVTAVSRSLVQRLFDGRVAPLVAHFSRHEALSARDVDELRQLLQEIEDHEH